MPRELFFIVDAPRMNAFRIGQEVGIEDGLLDAATLLSRIIVQDNERVLAEPSDRVKIRQAEEAHEQVGGVPDQRQLRETSNQHHRHDADTEIFRFVIIAERPCAC